jgi:hypothetical protein
MSRKKYVGLDFARRPGEKWPRLSMELTEIRHPDWCQSCATHEDDTGTSLQIWQEHDDFERPERVLVVLCVTCAEALIGPHPRLYARLEQNRPWPGITAACRSCPHRGGLVCRHPDALVRGGKGLVFPKPHVAHINMGSARHSHWMTIYPGPVEACDGREE